MVASLVASEMERGADSDEGVCLPSIPSDRLLSTGTTSKELKKLLLEFRVPVVAWVSMLCWSYLSNEVTKHSSGARSGRWFRRSSRAVGRVQKVRVPSLGLS